MMNKAVLKKKYAQACYILRDLQTMNYHNREAYDDVSDMLQDLVCDLAEFKQKFERILKQIEVDEAFECMERGDPQGWAEDNLRKIKAEEEINEYLGSDGA